MCVCVCERLSNCVYESFCTHTYAFAYSINLEGTYTHTQAEADSKTANRVNRASSGSGVFF